MNHKLAAIITWIFGRWLVEDTEHFLRVAARERQDLIDQELREITEEDSRGHPG